MHRVLRAPPSYVWCFILIGNLGQKCATSVPGSQSHVDPNGARKSNQPGLGVEDGGTRKALAACRPYRPADDHARLADLNGPDNGDSQFNEDDAQTLWQWKQRECSGAIQG